MAQSINTIILFVILVLTAIFRSLLYIGAFSGRFDVVLVAILAIIFLALISLATYRLFNTPIFRSTSFLAVVMVDLIDRTHIKILALLLVGAFLLTLFFHGCFTGRLEVVLMAIVVSFFFARIYLVVFLLRNAPVPQPNDDDNNEEDGGDEEGPVARNDHDIENTPTAADHEVDIDDQHVEMPARDDDRVQSTTSEHEPPARDDPSMQSTTSDHAEAVEWGVEDQDRDHDPATRDDHVDMPSTASEPEVDDQQDHHDQPRQDDQVDMPRTASDREVDDDQDHDDPPARDDHDRQSTGTASDLEVSSAESLPETISPELSSLPSTFLPR